MTYKREHIERHGIAVELVEIFADGKLRAAILSNRHRRDALRNLGRCGGVLVQATIRMIVRVDETRRYYEAVCIDHPGVRRDIDSPALPNGDNRISFDDDNSVFDGRTTRAVNQRGAYNRNSFYAFRAADRCGRRTLITGKRRKNRHQSSSAG